MAANTTRAPWATYRIQMTADFGFQAAAGIAPYLADLGMTHLYASPYLQAGKGSTHGYDVVNHKRMNIELGGDKAHKQFCEELARHGVGQVLDIVPNHMAIGSEDNDLWWDVLENGPTSRYATYFDIDWDAPEQKLRGKILLPILGDHYGRIIDRGEVKLRRDGSQFTLNYYDHASPVAPESLAETLKSAADRVGSDVLSFIAEGLFLRYQQVTGPVMAKGVEDTAFYCYYRLISLNEVGGDPAVFGTTVDEFHRLCQERRQHWPDALLATSTHDTKRGEDTRLRISLLSEIPEQWTQAVNRWSKMNQHHRTHGKPDRNDEYMLYQTLVGAWPISKERLTEYLRKAVREAKVHTNWVFPNASYEEAAARFAEAILDSSEFVADLEAFLEPLRLPACISSLAQTLIKYTTPGVPDLYQGTELWDRSLVDPDNRCPVDYDQRRKLLADLHAARNLDDIMNCMQTGLPKMFVIHHTMQVRRRRPELFGATGEYTPLYAAGEKAAHVVAYLRGNDVAVIAPRLVMSLGDDWGDTHIALPVGKWRNVFTREVVSGLARLAEVTSAFSVALLEREPAGGS